MLIEVKGSSRPVRKLLQQAALVTLVSKSAYKMIEKLESKLHAIRRVYLSAPAKTLMSLVLRLKSSKQVPSQWTLVENDGVILLHKLVQSAGITYVMSIQDGFLWSLRIGEERLA